MMMTSCFPSRVALICGFLSICVSHGEKMPEKPAVSVSLNGWEAQRLPPQETSSPRGSEFSLCLKITEESSWKAGWCETDGVEVTLKDSEGSCASAMEFEYFSRREIWPGDKTGLFIVYPKSWLPSAEAKWVDVQGTVPLVMFMDSNVSERVALKLVQGSSVPVLLKGGALDGGDVQAELSVGEYRDKSEGKNRSWTVFKLMSPSRVGIQRLDILDKDGMSRDVQRRGDVDEYSEKGYEWSSHMILDDEKGEELTLSVTYMAGFRKMRVPVSVRFGLFGTAEKKGCSLKEKSL